MNTTNKYQILGIREGSSPQEIRAAFRARARELHPDVNGLRSSKEQFRELLEAYQILSNPILRKSYDADLKDQRRGKKASTSFSRVPNEKPNDSSMGESISTLEAFKSWMQKIVTRTQEDTLPNLKRPINLVLNPSEAAKGIKTTLELIENNVSHLVPISIPAGITDGAVVHLKPDDGEQQIIKVKIKIEDKLRKTAY